MGKNNQPPTLVWFRNDLRLQDNSALAAAIETGNPILPVYVQAPDELGAEAEPGAASRVWLHHSLTALDKALRNVGPRLVIRKGPSRDVLGELIRESGADTVCWNRLYEPGAMSRDKKIAASLKEAGLDVKTFNSTLLLEPGEVKTNDGGPYKVFTPFWKKCLEKPFASPVETDLAALKKPSAQPKSLAVDDLELLPASLTWHKPIENAWDIGESPAFERLRQFSKDPVGSYHDQRNDPATTGTSRLSPHLHFGEIGPRQIVAQLREHHRGGKGVQTFLSEIGWREFAHNLLFHFPHTVSKPLRPEFEDFPWKESESQFKAWRKGRTGYPIVDAGMRELWNIGWMHNRVRMIVASFLVKHLLQPWQNGAAWFWDTLVDADLASNTLGWQWTSGCGADAAPYFRIFNPMTQGERFDADGEYVRRWVPELARLNARWIHQPWKAPVSERSEAGVRLGINYPNPIVDHTEARNKALHAYDKIKG